MPYLCNASYADIAVCQLCVITIVSPAILAKHIYKHQRGQRSKKVLHCKEDSKGQGAHFVVTLFHKEEAPHEDTWHA